MVAFRRLVPLYRMRVISPRVYRVNRGRRTRIVDVPRYKRCEYSENS